LAPVRFDTSMVMAGLPLTRVIEVASLKVGLTCGDVAERDRWRRMSTPRGMLSMSSGVSISDGTLTPKRPERLRARRPPRGCCPAIA
jgi:hypothetical protein